MFPQEIFYIISLQLPPGTLAVNKELSALYQDSWYKDYLEVQCPGGKLWKQTTYKDRYGKFLQSGKISSYQCEKINQCIGYGIAAASINAYTDKEDMILNFNGELYMGNTLIDSNVVAIDIGTYITSTNWYYYDYYEGEWTTMQVNPESPFLAVTYTNSYIYALTDHKIYYFRPSSGVKEISFLEGKAMTVLDHIYVLNNRGEIHKIFVDGHSISLPFTQVDNLYTGGFTTQDGTNKYIFLFDKFEDMIIESVVSPPGKLKNIIASYNIIDNYKENFLLIDDEVYYRNGYSEIRGPIATKIKQIMGNWSGIYFIQQNMAPEIQFSTFNGEIWVNVSQDFQEC